MPKPNTKNIRRLQDLYEQGMSLLRAGQCDVAIYSLESAREVAPRNFDVLHMLGIAYSQEGQLEQAVEAFGQALAIDPASAPAHMNLGIALKNSGKIEEALDHQIRASRLAPNDSNIQYNLANTLCDAGQMQEAISAYRRAIKLKPGHTSALNNLCNLLENSAEYAQAIEYCSRLLDAGSSLPYLPGRLFRLKARTCNWHTYADDVSDLLSRVDHGEQTITPFTLITTSATPEQLLHNAKNYTQANYPAQKPILQKNATYAHPRIRIAYISSDFFAHATTYLLAEALEKHDRNAFEVFAISFGHTRHDALRKRIEEGVEHFIDVSDKTDLEIAQLLRQLEIDIAIDLKGYTEACRTGIFAYRPAPIQVNYLGFPGTMGADYIDYIVADHTLVPPELEHGYSEKILRLPGSYQPNDPHRVGGATPPSREALGLPENGFVFCCFNNNNKITPDVFDVWMRLLAGIEGSVLWLFEDNPEACLNLRREASHRGIASNRLIFAPRTALDSHLARHIQADLFLDTLHFNAHTTASDALLTGLPVVTRIGRTFSSRVAASLLEAVGLRELITTSLEEYEMLALDLASKPERLRGMRQKLIQERMQLPLFDSARYIRNLEYLFTTAHARQTQGLPPGNIDCPAKL